MLLPRLGWRRPSAGACRSCGEGQLLPAAENFGSLCLCYDGHAVQLLACGCNISAVLRHLSRLAACTMLTLAYACAIFWCRCTLIRAPHTAHFVMAACAVLCRYTRAEHAESKQTIQQLLRELMLLRDAISRSQGSAGGRANNGPGKGRS